ncbi:MAG: hypothetical protein AVDCRST_MAG77-6214, partial [uncultured Chloroflexi bacterium]
CLRLLRWRRGTSWRRSGRRSTRRSARGVTRCSSCST